MSSRREKIEAMLKEEPEDQFLRYSLACEYDNEDRSEESLALFRELMADNPPHVHSFFRGAQLLVKLDRIEDAPPDGRCDRDGPPSLERSRLRLLPRTGRGGPIARAGEGVICARPLFDAAGARGVEGSVRGVLEEG